ncbi:MAG: hypothetical protein ABI823_20060 [Bryobacteraceae bacterium]
MVCPSCGQRLTQEQPQQAASGPPQQQWQPGAQPAPQYPEQPQYAQQQYAPQQYAQQQQYAPQQQWPQGQQPYAMAPTAVSGLRPESVRTAVFLFVGSAAFSVLSLLFFSFQYMSRMGGFVLMTTFGRSIVLTVFWIGLAYFVWQGQNWARIGVAILVAWTVVMFLLSMTRFFGVLGGSATISLAVSVGVAAVRVFGVYLLFQPQSNGWFRR